MRILPLTLAEREIFGCEALHGTDLGSVQRFIFARLQAGHTPPKLPAAMIAPQPPASSHYQQLPHAIVDMIRHGFPQRATDIILQYKPHYNSIFKKTQNLHVEILQYFLYISMQFIQTRCAYIVLFKSKPVHISLYGQVLYEFQLEAVQYSSKKLK